MKIDYVFAELPHPNSPELSVAELASILESKYQVIETFTKRIDAKFDEELRKQYKRRGYINPQSLQEWLKNQWREYIISGKAGYTIAAQKRGDPAFVETSAYYLSCNPVFTFSDEEKKLFLTKPRRA